jgi:hypothetical protein
VHQSAMTVNARLHKCHIRITPELYILNAALPHSVLVALTSSTAFTPTPVSILHISTSTSLYILLYQPLPRIHKQRGISYYIGTTRKFYLKIDMNREINADSTSPSSLPFSYVILSTATLYLLHSPPIGTVSIYISCHLIYLGRVLFVNLPTYYTPSTYQSTTLILYGITYTDTPLYLLQSSSSRIESINKDRIYFARFKIGVGLESSRYRRISQVSSRPCSCFISLPSSPKRRAGVTTRSSCRFKDVHTRHFIFSIHEHTLTLSLSFIPVPLLLETYISIHPRLHLVSFCFSHRLGHSAAPPIRI